MLYYGRGMWYAYIKGNAMTIDDIYITSYDDLKEAVRELGFLPFFPCAVPGFSIEENVDPKLWYSSGDDWKV